MQVGQDSYNQPLRHSSSVRFHVQAQRSVAPLVVDRVARDAKGDLSAPDPRVLFRGACRDGIRAVACLRSRRIGTSLDRYVHVSRLVLEVGYEAGYGHELVTVSNVNVA